MTDGKKNLPTRMPKTSSADIFTPEPKRTGGIVDTALTRFSAKLKTKAHEQHAALNRAKADEITAYGELAQSYENTSRIVARLDDLPEILALDREQRAAERAATRAQIADDTDERGHQQELTKRRRQRELEEADRQIVEALRQKFTSEQGFENQQRLKDRNLRIWEKRHEAQELDANVETERVRSELKGEEKSKQPGSAESIRAKAEEALLNALADGNDAEADRWQRVLDALGD